jgi:hypothetical protein
MLSKREREREREREKESSWPTYRWYDCIFHFLVYKIFSSFPSFLLNPRIQQISKCVEMAGSSSPQIRNICVFGGSSPGKEKEFLESTNHLGQVLAERKIHLVYGGGSLGLIGGVSIAVFLEGSQVLGGVPKALAKEDLLGKTIGEELQVSIMSD